MGWGSGGCETEARTTTTTICGECFYCGTQSKNSSTVGQKEREGNREKEKVEDQLLVLYTECYAMPITPPRPGGSYIIVSDISLNDPFCG